MRTRQIHLERGLSMNTIISNLYKLIHQTDNLIDFEESVRTLMYDVFASMLGDIFTKMNTVIVKEKQAAGWAVERNDEREIQFTFGVVRFTHTDRKSTRLNSSHVSISYAVFC